MDYKQFKKYTNNTNAYTSDEVDELIPMTKEEFEKYQYELDFNTGNNSNWDDTRAIITLKVQIDKLETEIKSVIEFISANNGVNCPTKLAKVYSDLKELVE